MMRLVAEIQMMMSQNAPGHRKEAAEPDVDGLWFWGGSLLSTFSDIYSLPVATRNPMLRSMSNAQHAGMIITEAERLHELVRERQPLPRQIVLSGHGYSILMKKSLFSRLSKMTWEPKAVRAESELIERLKGVIDAS